MVQLFLLLFSSIEFGRIRWIHTMSWRTATVGARCMGVQQEPLAAMAVHPVQPAQSAISGDMAGVRGVDWLYNACYQPRCDVCGNSRFSTVLDFYTFFLPFRC